MGNAPPKKTGRLGEAEELMKQGKKSKKDPEKALRDYKNAAKKLRGVIPPTNESLTILLECLENIGTISEEQGYHTECATAWQEAGRRVTSNDDSPNAQAVKYYQRASLAFRTNGQVKKSAESLLKAAKYCEDPSLAMENAKKACETVADEEKITAAREVFQKAVDIAINHNHFDLATELLEMQAAMYKKEGDDFAPALHQSLTGIIVILVYTHQRKKAHNCLTSFEQDTSLFGGSDQRDFCWKVLRSSLACDEKMLEHIHQQFAIYLVGNVSRLGRKMNFEELEPIEEADLTGSAFEQLDLREDVKDGNLVDDDGIPDLF